MCCAATGSQLTPKHLWQLFTSYIHWPLPPTRVQGCERSVITYSSLISACERAGECDLALALFDRMAGEGLRANTICYNSLITACAQGCRWQRAAEVFDRMAAQGCTPDVVSYTALISAYEKGGQWRRALQVRVGEHVSWVGEVSEVGEWGLIHAHACAVRRVQARHPPRALPALHPAPTTPPRMRRHSRRCAQPGAAPTR